MGEIKTNRLEHGDIEIGLDWWETDKNKDIVWV